MVYSKKIVKGLIEKSRLKLPWRSSKEHSLCVFNNMIGDSEAEVIDDEVAVMSGEEHVSRGPLDLDAYFDEEHTTTILIVQEESNPKLSNNGAIKCSGLVKNEPHESSSKGGGETISDKNSNFDIDLSNVKSLDNQSCLPISYQCIECSAVFYSYSCFHDHVQQVKSFKFHFTCKECFIPFETILALMNHMKVEHKVKKMHMRKKVICEECPDLQEFKTNAELNMHIKRVHPLNCEHCNLILCDQENLNEHMKSCHGNRLDCGICGKVMNSKKSRKTHELIHSERLEMCWVCGLFVKNSQILQQHIQKHNEKTHPCNICNRVFPTTLYLKRHMRSHLRGEDKSNICHICPKVFTRKRCLEKHILAHSTDKFFMCHVCGKCFRCNKKFVKHEKRREALGGKCPPVRKDSRFHNDIKTNNEFPNTLTKSNKEIQEEKQTFLECDINTLDKSNQKRKNKEIYLECNICGRKFKKTFNAIRHRKYHFCKGNSEVIQTLLNEPEEYKCDDCGYVLYTKHAAQFHRAKKHTGEVKPFACEFCGKKFRTRPQIMVHERMHSGERPYPCASCSKRFQTKTHLRHHEHVHSKEKPHLCPLCGLAFRSSGGLMEHTFRHEVDEAAAVRPFQCTYCGNRFFTERVLKAHITRNHSVESQQENGKVQDKEGVECEECGKVLSNLVSLKKHDRRMHRHMLVEVPQIDQVNMNNKNFKTLKIESIEDGLKE